MAESPSNDELLMAAILLNRRALSSHHSFALRERLGNRTDAELLHAVRTGHWPLPAGEVRE